MSDELLPYYDRELTFIRHLGAEFADAYPKIAGRLRLGADKSDDPHVARMIEAFAYLNARIRHKLDDDFPEITDALLGVLYPHYLTPIPSMAIVQFVLDRGQGELTSGYTIAKGAVIETEPVGGEPCRFRTGYPVTLWPIDLTHASLDEAPFTAPMTASSSRALGVIRLKLSGFAKDMKFSSLQMRSLRFFLKGQAQHVYPLYELVHNNAVEVVLADGPADTEPVRLPHDCIQPVGFGEDEGLLVYPPNSFYGYRLLTEFFAFPEKYVYFDLGGLDSKMLSRFGNTLEVYIFLNRITSDLAQNVSKETFQLGCTPMVNLYRQRAEPIQLTHDVSSYRVVPDVRRPLGHEIYTIDRVTATSPDANEVEYYPFYSFKHGTDATAQRSFWAASRRAASVRSSKGKSDRGTEVFLTLVDLDFKPSIPVDWTVSVETTCFNRDLPHRLPFGGDQPVLHLVEGAPLSRIRCLTAPTTTVRPPLKQRARWRLISHLALNHMSIAGGELAADAIQEILKLYDFNDSAETRSVIEGILDVSSRRVVGPVGGQIRGAFCRGIEVSIRFDEDRFTGNGVFLFASILERFMGLYCSINSFSKMVAYTKQRREELRRWPPRAGEKVLL